MRRDRAWDKRDFPTFTGKEFEALAANDQRVPAADFHYAEGPVSFNFADHKANLVHVGRYQYTGSIFSFCMANPKDTAQTVGDDLIDMRSDFFPQVAANRCLVTWNSRKLCYFLDFWK